MSNGTTTWTVRYTVSGGNRTHYKVFHDQAAARNFARWWERRGEGFESVVLPASLPLGDKKLPPTAKAA